MFEIERTKAAGLVAGIGLAVASVGVMLPSAAAASGNVSKQAPTARTAYLTGGANIVKCPNGCSGVFRLRKGSSVAHPAGSAKTKRYLNWGDEVG